MEDTGFTPTIYLKAGCPHCLRLRLFLLEAGLLDRVAVREFVPRTPTEAAVRDALAGKLPKVTFPAAEVAPGEYRADSAELVALFAAEAGIDPAALPVYGAYVSGIYAKYLACRRELAALKEVGGHAG